MSKERRTTVSLFPVDNGDMTLIALADNLDTKVLIDCNIRASADDTEDVTRDVASDLRDRLKRDSKGRPYVDAFLLSHADWDHCRGITKHFYLGSPDEYPDDKKKDGEKRILIREIWSSPLVFRRASRLNKLCDEAIAFNTEAKRRVQVNRSKNFVGVGEGDRILVLGEDEDGKTDDLGTILVKIDEVFSKINGSNNLFFQARLLAPLPKSDDDEDEEVLTRNHSSVVVNIELRESAAGRTSKNFLTGGDAEVAIWERLWERHHNAPSVLAYDLMQTPHHCSWHTLSYDSWSEKREKGEVSKSARSALSQVRKFGKIVASSCPVKDDDCDPPCYGAKREYEQIVGNADGKFYCTGEYPTTESPAPLEFCVAQDEMEELGQKIRSGAPAILTSGIVDAIGARAAETAAVKKEGNRRYA
jgi:hypothetical protein